MLPLQLLLPPWCSSGRMWKAFTEGRGRQVVLGYLHQKQEIRMISAVTWMASRYNSIRCIPHKDRVSGCTGTGKGQNTGTHMISVGSKLFCMRETVVQDWLMWLTQGHMRERQNGAWTLRLLISALGLFSALSLPTPPFSELPVPAPGTGTLYCTKRWGRPMSRVGRVLWLCGGLRQTICLKSILWVTFLPWLWNPGVHRLRKSDNGRNRGFWSMWPEFEYLVSHLLPQTFATKIQNLEKGLWTNGYTR